MTAEQKPAFDLLAAVPEPTPEAIKAARLAAGQSQAEAASIVGLGLGQRWYEFEASRRNMDRARWALYLLSTGQHPGYGVKRQRHP